MWWKLAGVWLTAAVIFGLLLLPVRTHAVKLDMPAGTSAATVEHIANTALAASSVAAAVIVLAMLAVPVWLSWRIVRKHKKANWPTTTP
jgi:heme/copper-type cytochrome/quinol oxidase subunit 2